MIQAIIDGQDHPDWLADKAKGTLRAKRPEFVWPCADASPNITA